MLANYPHPHKNRKKNGIKIDNGNNAVTGNGNGTGFRQPTTDNHVGRLIHVGTDNKNIASNFNYVGNGTQCRVFI